MIMRVNSMMFNATFGKVFLAIILATSLISCGGGGGGTTPSTTTTTTVSGSAGDGPVTGGAVSVSDANGAAVTTTPTNPTTGLDTQFTFTIPSGTALPLIITVSGGTDTVTGAAQDFPLRTAVATLPAGGSVTGNANPLSTLAVESALASSGGLTTANLTAAINNVLGTMGFGLATGTNPLSSAVSNANVANIVRANEAAAEMIRRASNTSGVSLANTISAIGQDLTDGVMDGAAAVGATNTWVANATASHVLNAQARVSAEVLVNNLTVTTPAGVAIPAASGVNFTGTLNTSITTTGHTGDVTNETPTQAFLDQTRTAINIANTLAGGGNTPLNNLLGGINALTAGSIPSTTQQTSLSGLTTAAAASFTAASAGANNPATAANAINAAAAAATDTTAPAVPTIASPAANTTTSTTALTITGSAESNALVTVLSGGTSLGTATANGAITGAVSAWTLTVNLIDGAHAIKAVASDAAGNASAASAVAATITVDTVAPTNQDTVFAAPTYVKGSGTVTIVSSGTASNNVWIAPAGTTVFATSLTMSKAASGTATSILAPATAGTYKVFVIDAAGNISAASTSTVTVDTVAPTNQDTVFAAPVTVKGSSVIAIVSSGTASNNVWIAPAGTTVFATSLTMSKAASGTATSIFTPATSGVYKVFVLDAVGNLSTASTATITVDNTAPINQNTVFSAPTTVKGGVAVTIVSSASASNNIWIAPAGTTVFATSLTMSKAASGTATSILAPATAGLYKVFVIDAVGNVSTASTATVTVDNTAPINQNTIFAAPTTVKGGGVIAIVSSGTASNNVWVASAGTTVFATSLTMSKAASGTATSILAPATAGLYKVFVIDAAGNISTASTATVTVDNTAPINQNTVFAAPTTVKGGAAVAIVSSATASNNVWVASAGTTVFAAGLTMSKAASGTATSILAPATAGVYKVFVIDEAGNISTASTAAVTVDNTAPINQNTVFAAPTTVKGGAAVTIVSSATASNNVWVAPAGTTVFAAGLTMRKAASGTAISILAPATAGIYKVFVIDAAGNVSTASTATITVDNTPPTVVITTPSNPTNAAFTATLTFSETVTGVALADFTVVNGNAGTFATISSTIYTALITPTAPGAVTVDVAANAATDAASNANTVATQLSVTYDNIAPAAPTISTPTTGTQINSTASVAIAGSAEAGATITVKDGVTTLGTTKAAGNGAWTFASAVLTEAVHSFTAAQTDLAGNTGAASAAVTYTVDITAPTAPSISTPTTGSFSTLLTPTIGGLAGSAEANATVNVYDTDGITLLGSTTAAGDGSWALTSSALATGSHTLTAKATDAATNTSAASTAASITINNISRFAYVANRGNNTVSMYTVNSTTGQLRHNGYVAAGTTPSHVASDPSGKFLYVVNNGSNNVSAYSINQTTGQLTSIATVAAGTTPDGIAIDPTGRFAYVGNQNSSNVSQYTINQVTGALIPSTPATVAAGVQPRKVTVDPSGRFAYVANLGDSTVSEYTIDQTTGVLTSIRAAIPSAGTSPSSVKVDPTARFAYVTNNFTSTISSYTINTGTGALVLVGNIPTGTNPGEVTTDPNGRFAYVANGGTNNISTYSINQTTGALASLGVTAAAGTNVANITVDPSGKFAYSVDEVTKNLSVYLINPANGTLTLDSTITTQANPRFIVVTGGTAPVTYAPKFAYVANQISNDVSAYTVDQTTGALTSIGATIAAGTAPRGIAVDPMNRFAYVTNQNSSDISAYTINKTTGVLTSVGPTVATGSIPAFLTVDPSGRFVYVGNTASNNVSEYSINQNTGALTSLGTIPAQAGASSVAVDPSGRFVYVANTGAGGIGSVSAYTINQTSGVLASIGAAITTAGTNSIKVIVSPSGRFAYVTNVGSNNISSYSINQTTGALTSLGALVPTGTGTRSIAIDPSEGFAYTVNQTSGDIYTYSINQNTGVLTAVGTPVVIATGTAPVSITIDPSGKFVYTANNGSNNVSAFTVNPSNGALTASGAFAAGRGLAELAVTNTFDAVAPAQPVVTSPAGGATVTTNTPTISGSAEAGSTITLFSGVTPPLTVVGTTTADVNGNWTLTSGALVNGTHTLTVTATDASGNVSIISTGVTITVNGNPAIAGAVVDGRVAGATLALFSDQAMTTQVGSGSTDIAGAFSVTLTVAAAPDPIYIKSVGGTDIDTGMPAPTMRFVGNTTGGNALTTFNITPLTEDVMSRVGNGRTLSAAQAAAQTAFGLASNTGANGLYGDPSLPANATLKSAEFKKLTAGTTGGTLGAGNYKMFAITVGETDIAAPVSTIANIAALTNPANGNFVDANVIVATNGNISGTSGGQSFQGKVVGSSMIFNIVDSVTAPTQVTRVVGNIGLNGSVSGNFTQVTGIGTTNAMTKGLFVGTFIPATGVNTAGLTTFLTDLYTPGLATGNMNIVARDIFTAAVPRVHWGQVALTALDVPNGSATMSNMALRIDTGSTAGIPASFAFTNGVYVKTAAPASIPTNLLVFRYAVTGGGNLFVATAVGLRRGIYFVTNATNNVITVGEAYLSKANSAAPSGFTAGATHDVTTALTHAGMPGQLRTAVLAQGLTPTAVPGGFTIPGLVTVGNGYIDTALGAVPELMIFQGSMFVMKQDANNNFLDNKLAGGPTEDHLRVMEFFDSGAMQGEDIQGGTIPGGALLMRNFPSNFIGFVHNQADPVPSFSGKLNFLARTQYATSFAGFANAFTSGSLTITAPTANAGSATLIATPAGGASATSTLTIDVPVTGAPGVYHINGALTGGGFIDLVWPVGGTKALYVISASATGAVQEVGEAFITK